MILFFVETSSAINGKKMLMIYGLKHGVQKTNQCNNPITKPLVEIVRLWTHFCRHQGIRILPINS